RGHGSQRGDRHRDRLGAGTRRLPGQAGDRHLHRPAVRAADHRRLDRAAGPVRPVQPGGAGTAAHLLGGVRGGGVRDVAVRGARRPAGARRPVPGGRAGGGRPRRRAGDRGPADPAARTDPGDRGRGGTVAVPGTRRIRCGDPDRRGDPGRDRGGQPIHPGPGRTGRSGVGGRGVDRAAGDLAGRAGSAARALSTTDPRGGGRPVTPAQTTASVAAPGPAAAGPDGRGPEAGGPDTAARGRGTAGRWLLRAIAVGYVGALVLVPVAMIVVRAFAGGP